VTPPRKKGVEGSSDRACPEGNGGPVCPDICPGPSGSIPAGAADGAVATAAEGLTDAAPGAAAGAWLMDELPIVQLISDIDTFCPANRSIAETVHPAPDR